MFSELLWKDWQMKLMTQNCDSNCLVIKSYPQKSTWHEQTYARRSTHTKHATFSCDHHCPWQIPVYYCAVKSPSAAHNPSPTLHNLQQPRFSASQLHSCPACILDILLQPPFYWHGVRHRVIGLSSSFCKIHFFALWLLVDAFCSHFVF